MSKEEQSRDPVKAALQDAALATRMTWTDIAKAIGVSYVTVNRYVRGKVARTEKMTYELEELFGWPHGHIEDIANGATPLPVGTVDPAGRDAGTDGAELRQQEIKEWERERDLLSDEIRVAHVRMARLEAKIMNARREAS